MWSTSYQFLVHHLNRENGSPSEQTLFQGLLSQETSGGTTKCHLFIWARERSYKTCNDLYLVENLDLTSACEVLHFGLALNFYYFSVLFPLFYRICVPLLTE